MEDSIFTKIVRGEIPCHKVYEDDKTLAFLDIHPHTSGHTLVISKKQVDKLWDLNDEDYYAVQATVKKVCKRIEEVLQPVRVGVQVIGLDVPHVHVHVFPFNNMDEYRRAPDINAEPDNIALAEMAKQLSF